MAKDSKNTVKKVFTIIGYFFVFVVPQAFWVLFVLSSIFWEDIFEALTPWPGVIGLVYLLICGYISGYIMCGEKEYKEKVQEDLKYSHTETEIKYNSFSDKYTAETHDVYENRNAGAKFGLEIMGVLVILLGGIIAFIYKCGCVIED